MRRRALLVSPAFFGYEHSIRLALENSGFEVDYVDERPSNAAILRAAVRVWPSVMTPLIRKHFKRLHSTHGARTYDLVLVIKGEVIPPWFLEALRARNPRAQFVFYAYDSIQNSPHSLRILDLFDRRFSFDQGDVATHDGLRYKPLFYSHEFEERFQRPRDFDVSFVGTLHSDRYRIVKRVLRGFPRVYAFFFVQARWYYYLNRFIGSSFSNVARADVSFRPLSRLQVAEVFHRSKAVLDIQRDNQSGLTMRTFEVLAAGAILITTNEAIRQERFFRDDWIIVLPRDESTWADIDLLHEVEERQLRLPLENFSRHRVDHWLEDLLEGLRL